MSRSPTERGHLGSPDQKLRLSTPGLASGKISRFTRFLTSSLELVLLAEGPAQGGLTNAVGRRTSAVRGSHDASRAARTELGLALEVLGYLGQKAAQSDEGLPQT